MLTAVLMLFGPAGAQSVGYTVQFEAAPTREEAEERVRQLESKDVSAYIVKSLVPGKGVFYRVRAGFFSNQNEAKRFGSRLQQRGVVSEFFVTTYEKPTEETIAGSAARGGPQVKPTSKTNQIASSNLPAAVSSSVASPPPNPATNSAPGPAPNSTNNPASNSAVGSAPAATATAALGPPLGFARFTDSKVGFSFDYPEHWTGNPLTDKEASDQRVNSGALFQSQKDAAFLNAIWNDLDKANSPTSENDLIIEVILKSMASDEGTKLEETARRVENQNGLIKTYLDLKAVFQTPGQPAPLDFLGKAVIIRASRGILLVVAFYSKDAPSNTASAADRIIASARAPE